MSDLTDYLSTSSLTTEEYKEVLYRISLIKSLFVEERRLREEAEANVHKAIIACGQLCNAMEPTRNKYKKK